MSLSDGKLIELAEKYDSFYLADLSQLRTNLLQFKGAFEKLYPKVDIGFSVKTNYLPAFGKLIKKEGYKAEVVSEMEYLLAEKLGFKGDEIIFNGPAKSKKAIERAIKNHSLIQVDSIGELEFICNYCNAHHIDLEIGLRLNLSVIDSRFGIALNDIAKAIAVLKENELLSLTTLHCHQMPPSKSAEGYRKLTREMLSIYEEMTTAGFNISVLNMGGGFVSPMPQELKDQLNFEPPTFSDYAEAIAGELAVYFIGREQAPVLTLEPGLAVLSDTLKFYSRIEHIKATNSGYTSIVSGSIYNIKPTKNKLNLPVRVVKNQRIIERQNVTCSISGSTCMEDDIMHSGMKAKIAVGDVVEFSNVGAYTLVLYPPFITPLCAILDNETGEELKSNSTVDSVFIDFKI